MRASPYSFAQSPPIPYGLRSHRSSGADCWRWRSGGLRLKVTYPNCFRVLEHKLRVGLSVIRYSETVRGRVRMALASMAIAASNPLYSSLTLPTSRGRGGGSSTRRRRTHCLKITGSSLAGGSALFQAAHHTVCVYNLMFFYYVYFPCMFTDIMSVSVDVFCTFSSFAHCNMWWTSA